MHTDSSWLLTYTFYNFVVSHSIFFSDGCRPYVEVFSENRCVLSTLQEYEKMRLFNVAEGKVNYLSVFCGSFCKIKFIFSVFFH